MVEDIRETGELEPLRPIDAATAAELAIRGVVRSMAALLHEQSFTDAQRDMLVMRAGNLAIAHGDILNFIAEKRFEGLRLTGQDFNTTTAVLGINKWGGEILSHWPSGES